MNKLLVRKLIIAIAAFAGLCLLLVFLYIRFFSSTENTKDIGTTMAKVDGFIVNANISEAESSLTRIFSRAHTASDYLQILKRFQKIAVLKQDFHEFRDYALRAFAHIGGNEKLAGAVIYACLRYGDIDSAVRIAGKFKNNPMIASFLSEAILRGGLDVPGEKNPLLNLESAKKPEPFIRSASRFDEPRLYLDAALLYAGQGNYNKAFLISEEYLQHNQFNEPAGFFAYDAGKYAAALLRLKEVLRREPERNDIRIIIGDINLRLDRIEDAAFYYEKAIQTDPGYSAIPYVNLAFISITKHNDSAALEILQKAQAVFPDSKEITLTLVKILYSDKHKTEGEEILSAYLNRHPDDFQANLLRIYLEWGEISSNQYRVKLRELFNSNPGNAKSCQILAWYLIATNESENASHVVAEYEKATNQANLPWMLHLKGVIQALNGNTTKAETLLEQSLLLHENWRVRYNYAVVLERNGRLKTAEDQLRQIVSYFERENLHGYESVLSKVQTRLGNINLNKGNMESAKMEFRYALELDPKNAQAFRLLKQLEVHPIK